MICDERGLTVVFPDFLDWLITTQHCWWHPGIQWCITVVVSTVLVAHNGFSSDFPILFAEVERRPDQLSASIFETDSIHFADTLPSAAGRPIIDGAVM